MFQMCEWSINWTKKEEKLKLQWLRSNAKGQLTIPKTSPNRTMPQSTHVATKNQLTTPNTTINIPLPMPKTNVTTHAPVVAVKKTNTLTSTKWKTWRIQLTRRWQTRYTTMINTTMDIGLTLAQNRLAQNRKKEAWPTAYLESAITRKEIKPQERRRETTANVKMEAAVVTVKATMKLMWSVLKLLDLNYLFSRIKVVELLKFSV